MKNKENIKRLFSDFEELNLIGPMNLHGQKPIIRPTIYVDGGIRHKIDGEFPYISVGDSDSTDLEHTVQLETNKNRSDLYHSLELVPENKKLFLYGFEGGRIDHEIMNFAEILNFMHTVKNCHISIYYSGSTLKTTTNLDFELDHHGEFSIINFEPTTLSIDGEVKYPVDNLKLDSLSSRTLSNKANGKFKIKTDIPVLIQLHHS